LESLVALQACPDYRPEEVQRAVEALFASLGGLERFVRPGDRVFMKVNLVTPATPEEAVSTHPEVVRAVARAVKRVGGVPLVGDNPAIANRATALKRSGIAAVAEQEGLEVPDLAPTATLECPESKAFHHFEVSKAILDADVLLNLPKLKTHTLTYLTLAMKNLFGVIPGTNKARWHLRAPSPESFAVFVADLNAGVRHHFSGSRRMLTLCDGVLAMEGEGPGRAGRPRPLGALLAGEDLVALDRVACALTGLDAGRVLTIKEGARRGQGAGSLEEIRLAGEPLERWAGTSFAPAQSPVALVGLGPKLAQVGWIRNLMIEHPQLEADKCVSCRRCAEICPAETIRFEGGERPKPRFGLDRCIRCYCCGEVCPEGAIHKSPTPLLGRLLQGS